MPALGARVERFPGADAFPIEGIFEISECGGKLVEFFIFVLQFMVPSMSSETWNMRKCAQCGIDKLKHDF